MGTPTQTSGRPIGWTRRRFVTFLLGLLPFIGLLALLAWGQLGTEGNPGNLLEHSQSDEANFIRRQAPAFEGIDLVHKRPIDNAATRGKIVMLNFWSSWCLSCKAEAQDLAEVYLEYREKPVEFIGVAIWDDSGDTVRHIQRYDITYPNIIDEHGSTAVTYGVRGVPEKFFIDTDGVILNKVIGPMTKDHLRNIIDSLLAV